MKPIEFEVLAAPVAKARPYFGKRGIFTPKKTSDFEHVVRMFAIKNRPDELLSHPLKLTCEFHVQKPKKTKLIYPSVRPDIDNYLKSVMDSLNKIIWVDDNCVCEVNMRKVYAVEKPKVKIKIEAL